VTFELAQAESYCAVMNDAESFPAVDAVYYVDEPRWYTRLTARFRLNWRREVLTVACLSLAAFLAGLALGKAGRRH
jgi:hypothetical protein